MQQRGSNKIIKKKKAKLYERKLLDPEKVGEEEGTVIEEQKTTSGNSVTPSQLKKGAEFFCFQLSPHIHS